MYILCDCSQAIEITVKKVVFTIRFRLALLESALSELNVKIVLAWIPGHQGIELNEFADLLAKEAACDIKQADYLLPVLSLTMMQLRLQLI